MENKTKTLLVLNPAAGKGKGKKIFNEIHTAIGKKFSHVTVETSIHAAHLFEIGRKAVAEEYDRIVTIGGDGTPFQLINGLYSFGRPAHPIQLGMIPAGTGNSFLLDFSEGDWRVWLNAILTGYTRQVDLVEFTYGSGGERVRKYCLNILGVGVIADILKLTNEKLKFLGTFGYNLAVLIRLFKGIKNTFTITVDGKTHRMENSALVVCNSKFTGGGMKIAPMADTEDGGLDMVVFREVNRREIIDIFLKVFKGHHVTHPKVEVFRGSSLVVTGEPVQRLMADGDLLGETPLEINVLPKELEIFCPGSQG